MPKNSTKTGKKRTQVNKLPKAGQELSADQAKKVKGGIGLLLPAVQKIREAHGTSVDIETKKLK